MDKTFKFIDNFVDLVLKPLSALIGLFIACAFVIGIVSRAILGEAIFGLEELVLLSVIWFYMLGATLASKEGTHLQADFIPLIFKSESVVYGFKILSTSISLVMAILFVTWSYDLVNWGVLKNQSTPVFDIPWYTSQASLLFSAVLISIYLIRDLLLDIKNYRKSQSNIKYS